MCDYHGEIQKITPAPENWPTISAGDIVLISGPGTIGLLCLQLCMMQGARVIVSGAQRRLWALRRRFVRRFGFSLR